MPYGDPYRIRELILGIEPEDATDALLYRYIEIADRVVVRDITIPLLDAVLIGNIDGNNTTFAVPEYPIADVDFDAEVTTSDVKVYGWTKAGSPDTKTPLSLKAVYPSEGLIELESPPSPSQYEVLTADYSYYEQEVDFNLVKHAADLYAAYLYLIRQTALVAPKYALGPLRIEYYMGRGGGMGREFPYMRFKILYEDIIKRIRSKVSKKRTLAESTEPVRRELSELG